MNKTELKLEAQEKIMFLMDNLDYEEIDEEMRAEINKQINRINKIFGYTQESWNINTNTD